ncbi:MAG: phospholipase D family protein [Wenzhouxiangella sp.]
MPSVGLLRFARRVWSIFLLLALLTGCALSPAQQADIEARIALAHGASTVSPDIPRPPSPLSFLALDEASNEHHLLVVDHGADALSLRLHLIRQARQELLLQNYIFLDDSSGRLLLDELIAAAERGVHVRVLVDALFSLPDRSLQAELALAHPNFAVKLYNPLFETAVLGDAAFLGAIACCFRRLNHRMHNKLLVADGRHGLIGGRNSADRYFDLDTRMNFHDLEILVTGDVVGDMVAGFDAFWYHPRARNPASLRDVGQQVLAGSAAEPVSLDIRLAAFSARADDPAWLDDWLMRSGYRVHSVGYFTDPPDKLWARRNRLEPGGAGPDSTDRLHALVRDAESTIWLQTPYFVLSPDFRRALAERGDGVSVVVSSNSLAATDAFPVYAISRRQRFEMIDGLGIRLYESKPFPADRHQFIRRYPELIRERAAGLESPMRGDPTPAIRDLPGPRVSLHAKVMVIDGVSSVVTSHNFDPRSEIFNTENGIIVQDPVFAEAMQAFIAPMLEPRNAWRVERRVADPSGLARLNRDLAEFFRRWPTLDFWPGYTTESFQLPSGVQHDGELEGFHEYWVSVGMSPDVVRPQRRFMAGLVSRMFGFLWPIM